MPLIIILFLLCAAPAFGATNKFAKWESEISKFEKADRAQMPPTNAILFVGSSSIRLWTNLAETFPDKQIVRRGFGGSTMADLLHFTDRIVLPYRPKQIFVYEGNNDLANGVKPEEVVAQFKAFVKRVRRELPKTQICYIAIKPSPSRWHLRPKVLVVNKSIRSYARLNPRVVFVEAWTPMLDANGQPRPELFVKDQLHLNGAGYDLWAGLIRPKLK